MSGGVHTTRTGATRTRANNIHADGIRASVPAIGPWVPTAATHLAFLAVAAGLCLLALNGPLWIFIGLLLAFAGTFLPNLVPRWWVIIVLGLSQLSREPSGTDLVFYLLLAGLHLLHVLGNLAQHMPWHGRMQIVALVRPLQRFVIVQTVVQGVAVGALLAFAGSRGTVPGLSIVAAAVLSVVAAVLVRGLRQSSNSGLPDQSA